MFKQTVLLRNWRYWPMQLLYLPLTLYIICIGSLRTGRLFYFAAANPLVPLGGFAGDSKYAIIKRIPSGLRPKTLFIAREVPFSEELAGHIIRAFDFPVIAKPDIGEGGFLVRKLNNMGEWRAFHQQYDMSYLIQEFIDLPMELSISVNDAGGKLEISGITEKRYLTLTGDGHSSIATLLKQQENTRYFRKQIGKLLGAEVNEILPAGTVRQPVCIGNWNYGTRYFHRPDWNTPGLTRAITAANEQIGLFHYARYDIKCSDLEALMAGRFTILEINGVKGEAIHLYDPENTLGGAYREIFRHWEFIRKISLRNLREGVKGTGIKEGFALLRFHRTIQKASLKSRITP
jgi:hypothetical protein